MNISRRSFLKGTTATAAVIAVPKLAESVEVETLPERMESCDPFKDGAVYCEIDGQWEYAGEVTNWSCQPVCLGGEHHNPGYIYFRSHNEAISNRFMLNGKKFEADIISTRKLLHKENSVVCRVDLDHFPPDLYQSLNAPYPIMLESVS